MSELSKKKIPFMSSFWGWYLPFILLLVYSISFAFWGTRRLWEMDVSFSTFLTLRAVFCFVPPGILTIWILIGNYILTKKINLLQSIIVVLTAAILTGMGFPEKMWSREKFRYHDCREALKRYFIDGKLPRCPGSLVEKSYLFFPRKTSSIPLPIAMDLPGNHPKSCNILYSDGSVIALAVPNGSSSEAILTELNRQHPLPPEELERLMKTATER